MNKEQVNALLPAMQHFANGGDLWCFPTNGKWEIQNKVITIPCKQPTNIIEDKHFDARKAFALGEEVQWSEDKKLWIDVLRPTWGCEYYRPKPKEEIYEWQWVKIVDNRLVGITEFCYEKYETAGWTKFEQSKRVKK